MESLPSLHAHRFKSRRHDVKIDQNKKIMMGVVLVLYVLYKMMGG
jgi:hypothetical protein